MKQLSTQAMKEILSELENLLPKNEKNLTQRNKKFEKAKSFDRSKSFHRSQTVNFNSKPPMVFGENYMIDQLKIEHSCHIIEENS